MQEVECIFCKASQAVRPFQGENGYTAVQCDGCGLVFVSPRPTIKEMKALYQGQETKVDLSAHLSQRDNKSIQARRSLRFIRQHKSTGRLLEIGSAAGYFLNEARLAGFEVQGLDLTRQFCEFTRNVFGLPVFEGILADAPFQEASFDVIYMRNVLSHLAYPIDEFRHLHRLLKPGGVVVLETGNVAELPPDVAGELELPDHLYHFSQKTIGQLLHETGFEVISTRRFTLVYALASVRWLSGVFARSKDVAADVKPTPAPRNLPSKLPRSYLLKKLRAYIAQFVRYDLGAILPNKNKRCTLVVVGRRR